MLDAVIDLTLERNRDLLKRGAVLVDERDFARRKAELEKVIEECAGKARQAWRDLDEFDARFQEAQAEQAGRTAYVEAMAATKGARENPSIPLTPARSD